MNLIHNVDLLPKQYEFILSKAKYTCYTGGLGSGKTYVLNMWAILQSLLHNNYGLITANTYKQLNQSTLTSMFNILTELKIPYTYKSTGHLKIMDRPIIYCMSMEKYDVLRGMEIGWWAADEAAFYKKEAVDVALGRLRAKNGPLQARFSSTPNGFNFLYEMFVEKANDNTHLIQSSARDNHHLPEEYVTSLYEQYDPKIAEQEIEGKFVNINSGQVYHAFNRNDHTYEGSVDVNSPIYVACDFNVSPITAVIAKIDNQDNIYIIDEIYMNDSNTFELADKIIDYKPQEVIPDSTGKARKTSATKSDHQILRDAGLHVVVTRNPQVKDRYNCVNGLIHKGKIKINKNCRKLIRDLEQFTYENKDPALSHISDALGYLCWSKYPLKKPRKPSTYTVR